MAKVFSKGKKKRHFLTKVCFFSSCFLLSLLLTIAVVPATAQPPNLNSGAKSIALSQEQSQLANPANPLQLGKQYYQTGQFFEAVNSWKQAVETYRLQGEITNQVQALNYLALAYQELGELPQASEAIETSLSLLNGLETLESNQLLLFAQAVNTRGSLQLLQGQTETALDTWKQAEDLYTRAEDETGKSIVRVNQAQALQALGQYRRAKVLLEQLVAELQSQPDTLLKAQGLRSLGVALQTIGDPLQSKAILEQSWTISKQLNSQDDISAVLFSLGNVARDLKGYDVAWTYYEEAAKLGRDPNFKIDISLNQLSLLVDLQKWDTAASLIPKIASQLSELPVSRSAIYAGINFAESLIKIEKETQPRSSGQDIAQVLAIAVQQARDIRDRRAEAYGLNQLGKLYQQNQQWADARSLTEQSLQISQTLNAGDLVARSAAQLGGILKQQGQKTNTLSETMPKAIAAYDTAFNHLQSLRSDLVAINSNVQFDFKESIEPIYREFVGLLLTPPSRTGQDVSQENLTKARAVIEALQLAELDNFFREACLDSHPVAIDEIDVQAAVIYPIILSDRLEVILSIPHQPLRHYATPLTSDRVEATLKQLYSSLSPGYPQDENLKLSEQVYNWLIKPAKTALEDNSIKTLIFVPDGFFRNLPMAVLYDGKQYIIEEYNIAISPGLQLFPQGLKREKLSVLAVGLTEARQGFKSLPGVAGEIEEIKSMIDSEVLLNGKFTRESFKTEIDRKPFSIVHLATHGQFSSNPDETFLLAWSDRISIKDFDLLFQNRKLGLVEPIDLLVMSACQTAAGDNRATLGLAGFALRSGARSTIASLWSVNDESTAKLMREFYHQLTTSPVSKAEALRQAQLKLLQNPLHKHPYFWASFVLVGNWL
jgi:CHAT domain-containing protein/tetratricopeptide (TPR) repeat protein